MRLRYQATGRAGYEAIVTEASGLRYLREFGILCLGSGERYDADTGACEATLHLIEGACDLATAEAAFSALGERETPFSGPPTAVYLPAGTRYAITARSARLEVAITLAATQPGGAPRAILPQEVTPKPVGRDNWGRTVTLIAPPDFPSQQLILGETLNPPGNWSGVPTHKHDTARAGLESVHEELYYFRVDREGGWGAQRIYDNAGLEELLLLQDRVVTVMPRGYHTVVAAPGFTLFYAFVLAGPAKPLLPSLDPVQAWIAA